MPKQLEQFQRGAPALVVLICLPSISYSPLSSGLPADTSFPMYYLLGFTTTSQYLTEHRNILLSETIDKRLRNWRPFHHVNGRCPFSFKPLLETEVPHCHPNVSWRYPFYFHSWEIRITSKGAIYSTIQENVNTDFILSHLQQKIFPVANMYRFPRLSRDSPDTPNPNFLLTFNTPFQKQGVKKCFQAPMIG